MRSWETCRAYRIRKTNISGQQYGSGGSPTTDLKGTISRRSPYLNKMKCERSTVDLAGRLNQTGEENLD